MKKASDALFWFTLYIWDGLYIHVAGFCLPSLGLAIDGVKTEFLAVGAIVEQTWSAELGDHRQDCLCSLVVEPNFLNSNDEHALKGFESWAADSDFKRNVAMYHEIKFLFQFCEQKSHYRNFSENVRL